MKNEDWRKSMSDGKKTNIMLRSEAFAYIADFDVSDASRFTAMKEGDEFSHDKKKYEIVEINKHSNQIVLTLKESVQ